MGAFPSIGSMPSVCNLWKGPVLDTPVRASIDRTRQRSPIDFTPYRIGGVANGATG
jgi:hypothetical protein